MTASRRPARRGSPARRTTVAAAALAVGALGCAALAAPPAGAAWGGAQIVSVDNARAEQADGPTTAVDISGDGRYVVFQTRASNFFADDDPDAPGTIRQGGVFRFDRQTGAIALVADGDVLDDTTGEVQRRGAHAPSVSDDGRWVAFASAQQLAPQDVNDNIDVYVRDMARPIAGDRAVSGAYTLVSARDGGDQPARYELRDPPLPGRNPGAAVFAGQAISGDGRYVAFRTTEQRSDLPARDELDTPPGNVFVRDVAAKRTVLVSRTLDGAAPAGGALAPVVISRDGSTVSWVGENGPLQTRMIDGESLDNGQRYYLWTRWNDAGAATRRVTGLADPDDPGCGPGGRVSSSPIVVGPCDGPLTDVDAGFGDISSRAPSLSADGWTVAFVSGAGPRPSQDADIALDAYVTSMRPGLSRKAATRVVTKGTTAPNPAANSDVEWVVLSADGRRLLLLTGRRQYLPPAPPLIGEPRTSGGGAELYSVDLAGGGGTRRMLTPGGVGPDDAIEPNPSLSADGRVVSFVSKASNLVPGDANEFADAFAAIELDEQRTLPPPAGLGGDAIDQDVVSAIDDFDVTAVSRRDGTLLLRVVVPAPGALEAVAATRPVAARRRARTQARARPKRRARAAAKAKKPRQVSRANGRARRAGTTRLTLRLTGRDLRAVRRGTPLPVRVTVTLTPAVRGARARRASTLATFRVTRRPRR